MRDFLGRAAMSLGRASPIFSGCGCVASSSLVHRLIPAGDTAVRLRDGSLILVDPTDYIGRAVVVFGDLDPKLSWICARLVLPGDTVIDVGANYGVMTLQAARIVGRSGIVHAFEPQVEVARLLRRSCDLNAYDNVVVHEVGLSDRDAEVSMFVPPNNRGMGSVDRPGSNASALTVTMRAATRCLGELGANKVQLMKIDVEGHEEAVIRGSVDWLAAVRPDLMLIEAADYRHLWDQPWIPVLERLAYTFYAVPRTLLRSPRVLRLARGAAVGRRFHDVVAVSGSVEASRRMKAIVA